jgi:response regulator RpfG family c-di-GMP phosphodiesterase
MKERRTRILILEDDEDYVDTLEGYLKEDHDVYSASDLDEAQKLLGQQTFHLAIVDISLVLGDSKDEQGFDLIEDLRATEILRDMSIIIVTAYPTEERVRKAFKRFRVHDFIDKMTLDPKEFKQEVANAIADSYRGILSTGVDN